MARAEMDVGGVEESEHPVAAGLPVPSRIGRPGEARRWPGAARRRRRGSVRARRPLAPLAAPASRRVRHRPVDRSGVTAASSDAIGAVAAASRPRMTRGIRRSIGGPVRLVSRRPGRCNAHFRRSVYGPAIEQPGAQTGTPHRHLDSAAPAVPDAPHRPVRRCGRPCAHRATRSEERKFRDLRRSDADLCRLWGGVHPLGRRSGVLRRRRASRRPEALRQLPGQPASELATPATTPGTSAGRVATSAATTAPPASTSRSSARRAATRPRSRSSRGWTDRLLLRLLPPGQARLTLS